MTSRIAVFLLLVAVAAPAAVWDPDVRLTDNAYADNAYWSCQRRIAVDPVGRVHVVWYVQNSGLGTYNFQVYYKRWYPDSGWTADTMLSEDLYQAGTYNKYPSIAVDSGGRVFAIWASGSTSDANDEIYYKRCLPTAGGNGGWDEASNILSANARTKECPNLACTPDGRVHAVWLEYSDARSVAYRERIDTTWQPQVDLEPSAYYKVYPSVAGSRDNDVHIAWHGRQASSGFYDVYYKARVSGTWQPLEEVSFGDRHQMYPCIATDPVTNEPHVLWRGYAAGSSLFRIIHSYRSAGVWQERDTLSEPLTEYSVGPCQIAFTEDGLGHAVWKGESPGSPTISQIRYAERSLAGEWSDPVELTDTTGDKDLPSIASGGSGPEPNHLHLLWADRRDGNSEMYYKHGAPGQGIAIGRTGLPAGPRLAIAPNPVRGKTFRVNWTLPTESRGRIRLLDVSGRTVLGTRLAGARCGAAELDVSALAAGVYLVRLETGQGAATGRVTVQR